MKKIYIILMLGIAPFLIFGQDFEFSHQINMSISFPKKLRINVSYDLYARSHIEIVDRLAITPFADLKVGLFSNHLGSPILQKYNSPLYANFTLSYGGLLSYDERMTGIESYVPVFTTHYANTFNNSYLYNIGFGSSQMFQLGLAPRKATVKNVLRQQVGNLMVSVHDVYLTYYNDGGPVLQYFGDREDRFWTGGLAIGSTFRVDGEIHHVEVAFDKFTGFTKNAFEATGLLFMDNVLYKDIEQFSYNTGRIGVKYFNHNLGMGVSTNVWNFPFDLQDWLHKDVSNNPYHHKIEHQYIDVELFKFYSL